MLYRCAAAWRAGMQQPEACSERACLLGRSVGVAAHAARAARRTRRARTETACGVAGAHCAARCAPLRAALRCAPLRPRACHAPQARRLAACSARAARRSAPRTHRDGTWASWARAARLAARLAARCRAPLRAVICEPSSASRLLAPRCVACCGPELVGAGRLRVEGRQPGASRQVQALVGTLDGNAASGRACCRNGLLFGALDAP